MPLSRPLILAFLMASACTGEDPEVEGDTLGLPEGQSTWTGRGDVGEFSFLLDLTLDNEGGDLTGTVTVSDDPDAPAGIGSGTYTMEGTHAPESGVFALAPVAWTQEPAFEIEMVGATGTFDPDAGTLQGMLRDWAAASDNTLQGGPFSMDLTEGGEERSAIGARGAELAAGDQSFSGSMSCTGASRDVVGTLSYDGTGAVTGSMTIGDPGIDNPLGSFAFDGAHNPSTGTITLAPQPWEDPAPTTFTFMVSGVHDASGSWTGDLLTNVGACPPGTWAMTVVE